jgi:hypothetical protein
MYYCTFPHYVAHAKSLMNTIEGALGRKGLALVGEWSSTKLTSEQSSGILARLPYAPIPALTGDQSRVFMTKQIDTAGTLNAVNSIKRLLSPDVNYAGTEDLPQFFNGRNIRTVQGVCLSLKHVMMIPITDEERMLLDVFEPRLQVAA